MLLKYLFQWAYEHDSLYKGYTSIGHSFYMFSAFSEKANNKIIAFFFKKVVPEIIGPPVHKLTQIFLLFLY